MLLDGKQLSASLKEAMHLQVNELEQQYGRRPSLAVIIVGDNPASRSYVRGKIKAAQTVGITSRLVELPDTVSETELLLQIQQLNNEREVDGILVQLPLPKHINEAKVIDAIVRDKDVDGFHPANVADLWLGRPCILPCTPKGIMALLRYAGIETKGKTAVVIGRSNIVGKPVAKMLLDTDATVVMAHSKTHDLPSVTRQADILVAAIGRPRFVTVDMIKPGAVIIDVGINRLPDGTLCGDVDYEAVAPVVSAITPVPGGVGPMTIAMLMENTIECFLNRVKASDQTHTEQGV